jgi:hypothetical protein
MARRRRAPEAIERWVIEATKVAIRADAPRALEYEDLDAKSLLERLVDALASGLSDRDRIRRARAQNLIQLTLIWLLDQRALDPLDALRVTSRLRGRQKTASAPSPRRDAVRVVSRAGLSQLADLSLIARLGDEAAARAVQERNDAVTNQERLQAHIVTLESDFGKLREQEQHLTSQVRRLDLDLERAQREIDEQRQLRQLDRASQRGQMRQFLSERLGLLLSDARDALDFDPPHVDAARQRIESARDTINKEIGKFDE